MKRLERGDAITIRAGGGGGFGPPEERAPEAVANDVRQGYVSFAVARDVYGVVLDRSTLAVDTAATARRRAEIKRREP
jgi:N-methylhydantoinase B